MDELLVEDMEIGEDMEMPEEVEGGTAEGFMEGVEEQVFSMIKEMSSAPKTAQDSWAAFTSAINWNEQWIQGLLVFHVVMLTAAIVGRKNLNFQCFLFLIICICVFMSEYINSYGAANWQSFATQNYFDAHGIFIGIMFSGPLLFVGFVQLVNNHITLKYSSNVCNNLCFSIDKHLVNGLIRFN